MTYKLLNGLFSLDILTIFKQLQCSGAFLLLFIVYAFLSHYFYKKRLHRLLDQQQQALKNERQRISSEIHDDIGAGFFAIKLFADLVSKNGRRSDEITQLSSMINDLSEKIKEIIWSTNYENDNLENLIYYLEFQTIKLFEHSQTSFRVHIPDQIPEKVISSEVRKNIYLIVKEFVHNAIKHSGAAALKLRLARQSDGLFLLTEDNGKGFDVYNTREGSKGLGLKSIENRCEMINASLKIVTKKGEGCKVIIKIPEG